MKPMRHHLKFNILKPLILTVAAVLISVETTNSQILKPTPNSTPEEFYDYHMLKSKKNKNAALICSITGGALLIGGIVITISEMPGLFVEALFSGEAEGSTTGPILFISGIGAGIASIPLFVSKRKHLEKAQLYLSSAKNTVGNIRVDNSNSLGISVVIPLN
jgi:hypothetical protein